MSRSRKIVGSAVAVLLVPLALSGCGSQSDAAGATEDVDPRVAIIDAFEALGSAEDFAVSIVLDLGTTEVAGGADPALGAVVELLDSAELTTVRRGADTATNLTVAGETVMSSLTIDQISYLKVDFPRVISLISAIDPSMGEEFAAGLMELEATSGDGVIVQLLDDLMAGRWLSFDAAEMEGFGGVPGMPSPEGLSDDWGSALEAYGFPPDLDEALEDLFFDIVANAVSYLYNGQVEGGDEYTVQLDLVKTVEILARSGLLSDFSLMAAPIADLDPEAFAASLDEGGISRVWSLEVVLDGASVTSLRFDPLLFLDHGLDIDSFPIVVTFPDDLTIPDPPAEHTAVPLADLMAELMADVPGLSEM